MVLGKCFSYAIPWVLLSLTLYHFSPLPDQDSLPSAALETFFSPYHVSATPSFYNVALSPSSCAAGSLGPQNDCLGVHSDLLFT